MTRLELYHERPKQFHLKGLIFFILSCAILVGGFMWLNQYSQNNIRIEAPKQDMGRKVVVHLPNGKDVNTYENLIVQKGEKLFYKGERNTLDLTGGTIDYKEWK